MNHNAVEINIKEGDEAPRYHKDVVGLEVGRVVITEKGTKGGQPVVDFQMKDQSGNKYWFCFTGTLIDGINGAVLGVIKRNEDKSPDTSKN